MADALLSVVLERLASVVEQQIRDELTLVLGVEAEIQSLKDTLQSVRDVLEDAERRQVKEKSVQGWLEKLKDMAYQMDDVVDEWSTAILQLQIEGAENSSMAKKVSSCIPISSWIPSFFFKQVASRRDIALKIKKIKQQLDVIASDRTRFNFISSRSHEPQRLVTTSAIDPSRVYDRDTDVKTILGHLLSENCQCKSGLYIISIVGTGGMGKTTLAQLAYNHPEVQAHFDERVIWVCASHPFDPTIIFIAIVEALQKKPCNLRGLEAIQKEAQTCIAGNKFLLVLDDMWTEDDTWTEDCRLWEQLMNTLNSGAVGSRILVTTRKEKVVMMIGTTYKHPIRELSPQHALVLFHQIAFLGKSREKEEELKEIGKKIVDKCKGLPLAIKTLGNLMRLKNNKEEWESVLKSEVWLDVIERYISPPLLLSYYDLPPAIKRCFSYCAVFPKGSDIQVDKLIKLWMAQNYLNCDGSKEMETVGREYFEYLAAGSFFQDFEKDGEDNIINCKMHDIVHDFAQFLAKNECFIMEDDNQNEGRSFQKIHHATLILGESTQKFVDTYNMKNLHTLLLEWKFNPIIIEALSNLFPHLVCLRALDLRYGLMKELPKDVGKLIHLRYLNLSGCWSLECLPESICDLCNLQTLNIRECEALSKLPHSMGKLINLRHLENSATRNLKGLPKGIGRLNALQRLEEFIVSSDGDDECKIGDLRHFNNIRGRLKIIGLGEVENAEEAEKAEMKNKIHLHHLTFKFDWMGTKGVAEALQPHSNLKSLSIWCYGGTEWPSWMMRSSLTQLKNLSLKNCRNCSCMPPLGELPFLEELVIKGMDGIKYMGGEFLGSSSTIAFPKLKTLSISFMVNWEKWEVKEEDERSIMPCLSYLEIYNCKTLEGLPDLVLQSTPMRKSVFFRGDIQQKHYNKYIENNWQKVSHILKAKSSSYYAEKRRAKSSSYYAEKRRVAIVQKRIIQEKIRVAQCVQKAALQFIVEQGEKGMTS